MNNSQHYDSITNAWQYMLGKNFHWGYFNNSTESLEVATVNLIHQMISNVSINEKSKILDIGCGIGTPAIYIHKLFNCYVTGISNSQSGIDEAIENTRINQVSDKVMFLVKDALNNEFDENSFDISWLMEMSHLIEYKEKLVKESIRPLKKGGKIVLCDLMFKRPLTAKEIFINKENIIKLAVSFGQARIETFDFYLSLFKANKLENIKVTDISDNVTRTLLFWKKNVENNYETIIKYISQEEIKCFMSSCEILSKFYEDKIWGYGIISGQKNY